MLAHHPPPAMKHVGSRHHSQNSYNRGGATTDTDGQLDVPCYWVNIWSRLNTMRSCLQLCDIDLEAEDGTSLRAHSAVLAASSEVFHGHFTLKNSSVLADIGNNKVLVRGISGRSLKITLDFVYGVTPTEPDELLLLLEGGQAMGITGALIFCKRKNVVLPDAPGHDSSPVSSAHSPNGNVVCPRGSLKSDKPDNPIGEDLANQRPESPNPMLLPKDPHSDIILDLSFNDLDAVAKCPHLRKLANEDGAICLDSGPLVIDEGIQLSRPNTPSTGVDSSFGKDELQYESEMQMGNLHHDDHATTAMRQCPESNNTAAAPIDSLTPIQSNLHTDLDGEVAIPPQDVAGDLGIDLGDLTCPFAKSVNANKLDVTDSNAGVAPHHGTATDGDASLQCPFLKSLEDLPPDTLMETEDDMDKATCNKPPTSTTVKILQSLDLLSGNGTSDEPGHEWKTSSYDRNYVSCSAEMTDVGCRDTVVSLTTSSAGHLGFNQEKTNSYMSHEGQPIAEKTIENLFCDSQNDEATTTAATMVSIGLAPDDDTGILLSLNASSPQKHLLSQNTGFPVNSPNPLKTKHLSPDPLIQHKQMLPSTSYAGQDFVIGNSNQGNRRNYLAMDYPESQRQHTFRSPGYSVSEPHGSSDGCDSENGKTTGANPQYQALYPADGTACRMAPSLIDTIYCDTSGNGYGNTLPASGGGNVFPEMHINGISPDSHRMLSPPSRCPSRMPSPDTRSRSRVVSPDCRPHSRMVSPDGFILSDQSINNTSNITIKAQLKLNRRQEYSCLMDDCIYSNKCLDYMQSHMFRKHGVGHPDVPCPLCNKSFFSASQVKGHGKRAHKPEVQEADCDMMCDDCDEVFPNGQKLQTHRLKSHFKGRLFMCEECDFRSPRKKDVQAHMVSQHNKIPPGVQVYTCMHCDYKCTDKNRAEEHQAMHTGQPKFVCKMCSKSYTTRRGMRTHMQYHSTERPHQCETCNASFKVRSKLRDHIRLVHTHVGIKPYECSYCGHRTALRGNCNQHCRKHHPELPVSVIDHQQGERRNKRNYDYAGLRGDGIEECKDVRKHLRAASP